MQTVDNDMALKIYIKARATPKVVAAFAERREFDKILIYSKQVSDTQNLTHLGFFAGFFHGTLKSSRFFCRPLLC